MKKLQKLRKDAEKAIAIGGILANLNNAPGLDTHANHVDQWTDYTAKVRLPETRRQIKRQTDKQLGAVAALDKRIKKQAKNNRNR